MTDRDYDLVLYGVTGFVGRQTLAYVVKHRDSRELRFAIAGRNRAKLESVRTQIGGAARKADILVVDSRDQPTLDVMTARTRVLLNTAGPFSISGDAVVDACVRSRTHYVDITGETTWVRGLIDRYHARCAAEGTRIIPFCGFDSVPSDLGAWLVVRRAWQAFGVPCASVKAYFQASGGFNGGTIATFIYSQQSRQQDLMRDPFLLDQQNHSAEEAARNGDISQVSFDAEVGTWVGPFFMAAINTRVVRRSAALAESYSEPYGPYFPVSGVSETRSAVGAGEGNRDNGSYERLHRRDETCRRAPPASAVPAGSRRRTIRNDHGERMDAVRGDRENRYREKTRRSHPGCR